MASDVLLASNRGPVSFVFDEGGALRLRRGAGGLVSAMSGLGDARSWWVCAALSEADRTAARHAAGAILDPGEGGPTLRMLDIDHTVFDHAYNAVANRTLWFVHHLLYATPTRPEFGAGFRRHWEDYRRYNAAFADALAEEAAPGARVLVQDYHLSLVPALLRERRPDVRIAHFSHTPWAPPEYFAILPDEVGAELLTGLLGADSVGFLTDRWASAFTRCCAEVLGLSPGAPGQGAPAPGDDGQTLTVQGRRVGVRVHPLGVDAPGLRERGAQPDVEARLSTLRTRLGERRLLLRVDRTELSKNIVRGLHAYRELLRYEPSWRERVVHLALAYPSRHDLPEYREYTADVQRAAAEINDEFATAGWRPVVLDVNDDYPRSLAAMRLADVLVTNPIRDGMNLVAKEGPVLSDRGLALVLSREAGAAAELGAEAFLVNPFDVSATARAMHEALLLDPQARRRGSDRLAGLAAAHPPAQWLAAQLAALAP